MFTEPLGQCTIDALSALLGYGLTAPEIEGLCRPVPDGMGCDGTQSCLNMYLISKASDAMAKASDTSLSLDVMFTLYNGYMVFMMQLG
jgi:hypothetical protein